MKDLAELTLAKSVKSDLMNFAINVSIKRFFTDINGTIIAAPAALQISYPIFLLGGLDFRGGFKKALESCPPMEGVKYLKSFINGVNTPFEIVGFTGLSDIQGQMKVGDLVSVYVDSYLAPTYLVWIINSVNNASYGSIIDNLSTTQKDDIYNRLYIDELHYYTTNNNNDQWNEPIFVINMNNLGLNKTDSFLPLEAKTPFTFLPNVLAMKLKFKATQFIGLASYMRYGTNQIQMIFKIKK